MVLGLVCVCVCVCVCVFSTSIILIMLPFFFAHSCLSPRLPGAIFVSTIVSVRFALSVGFFLNPVIFPPFPPRSSAPSAALASETKGEKMKAFVLQWLCIWCQSGSFLMTVQTVIRVCPYKELLPLMGLVWIHYWRTHTSSAVGGRFSIWAPWPRCVWVGFCGFASQWHSWI